ncbi:hypothetical protein F4808DRAFT_476210 [Astrocystis sublimbata]|nr:hypothetical protein F4808DRAFT_476210 [Astrocystis sublimbata]
MRFTPLLFSTGLCAAALIPRQDKSNSCENPEKRYIDSVLCLRTKPSGIGLNSTLYDDFPFVHASLNDVIHSVAMFLPWHRYFVHVYHDALKECGYTGPMAYWDWTLDTADVPKSAIWDPDTGFGGNGDSNRVEPTPRNGDRLCVSDGPLRDVRPSYIQTDYDPHCFSRNWNNGTAFPGDMISSAYTTEAVATVHASADYPTFRHDLESGPHGAIHSAVGGDLGPSSSPNGPEATLEDVMPFNKLAGDIKVSEVMTTQNALLCCTY